MQYTLVGSGHVCKDGRQLKESTHQTSQEICLASESDFVAAVAMQMLTTSTPIRDIKRAISRGNENIYKAF